MQVLIPDHLGRARPLQLLGVCLAALAMVTSALVLPVAHADDPPGRPNGQSPPIPGGTQAT